MELMALRRPLTGLERYAEMAVLLAMANLPARGKPLNSETVPKDAARRLVESSGPGISRREISKLVEAAIDRLEADGLIYAPSKPHIRWRHVRLADDYD
jgi:hypothetical protein